MKYIHSFLTFWYDFIVGDDWTVAAAIAVTFAVTYWLTHQGIPAWWLLPVVVILTTGVSTWRTATMRS